MDEQDLPGCFRFWQQTVNYGRSGGTLDATDHLLRAGCEIVDLELEIQWLLAEAEWHANWGV
jgi:hypothetical protein